MAINDQHRELKKYQPDYELIRTIIAGDRAVKAAGEKYVPRLTENTNAEYSAYINRPSFENYSARVLDGLVGLAFSKVPEVVVPTGMEKLLEDISLSNLSLNDMVTELVREVLAVGRCGILVDMPSSPSDSLTVAQAEALNIRPYARIYKSESIINWRTVLVNNVLTLDMVILCEQSEKWTDDYTCQEETIYRVLIMRDGVYTQEIFRENDKKQWVKDDEIVIPMMNGKPMSYIPFVSITPDKLTINPAKPPMLDLSDVNISHFRLKVDFYHGIHFAGIPSANYFVGGMAKETTIRLGASTANVFNDPNGHAEYMEIKGTALGVLRDEKDTLVERMASLGARFLADDKKVAETTESQETRSSGERAILISAVNTISGGVTWMLEIMAQWMKITGDISYKLNTDYNLKQISPAFLKELWSGSQIGKVTDVMIYNELVKGEVIDPTTYTIDDYKKDMEAMQSNMTFQPTTANNE